MIFTYIISAKDSDDIEDENSLMYMAKDVQNVDVLNFDDSDVSIGEEEEDPIYFSINYMYEKLRISGLLW